MSELNQPPPAAPRLGDPPSKARSAVSIRLAALADAEAIQAIYNVEFENHTSTFDLVTRSIDGQRNWLTER